MVEKTKYGDERKNNFITTKNTIMISELILKDGFKGNARTVCEMWKLVNAATKDETVIAIATKIIADIPARDYTGMANAIFSYVKKNIKFLENPTGTEMLSDPLALIERGAGDCAEQSVLVASLAQALGMNVRFKTILTHLEPEEAEAVKRGGEMPNHFNHIYTQFYLFNARTKKYDWFSADTTEPESYLGWEPPDSEILRLRTWDNPLFGKGLGQPESPSNGEEPNPKIPGWLKYTFWGVSGGAVLYGLVAIIFGEKK